jgi:valyl-tRNA synthetase
LLNSKTDDSIIQIIIKKEKIGLKFETNINLNSQKDKLENKLNQLQNKIVSLNQKLNNKNYVKKAPKNIVANDKILLKDLKIEQSKLKSIVSSIN